MHIDIIRTLATVVVIIVVSIGIHNILERLDNYVNGGKK